MKTFLKFGLSALICLSFTILLDNPIPKSQIPPLGKLLNPFTGFWQNGQPKTEKETVILEHQALTDKVKIIFDNRRVPHIFAENTEDAIFTQGYLLAQNRLWQMDISTRSTSGRLCEIMGSKTLKRDQLQRRRGMVFAAKNAVENWKTTPEYRFVEAYTNGVNAFIEQMKPTDYPIEFKILNYKPEPWTPLKTALFNKAMAETLSRGNQDIEMTNVREILGDSITNDLYPQHFPNESPIIPNEVAFDFQPQNTFNANPPIGLIEHKVYSKPPPQLGSNNWAVSGSKTASGYPILCNDPHLSLTLPSIWYELQMNTPTSNVYGVCLPGVPGIVIGFNEDSAWGVTNVGHDVVDWYKIKWTDAKKEKYLFNGQEKAAELKIESYEVKGQGTVYDTVRYTHWGPVVHQTPSKLNEDLAMRWVAHNSAGNELKTFHGLNTNKNYSDYRKAITNFASPAQNIVYANKENDIGITVQGQLPIRSNEQAKTVQSGETSESEWSGFIPMKQLPHVKNPARGFVASANQRSTSTNYPYPYTSMHGGFEAFRGRTLNRKLDTMEQITVKDMQALQTDVYGLKAAEALPALLALLENAALKNSEKKYFDILKQWDYQYERKAAGPILFNNWFSNFYKKTWDEIYKLDKEHEMSFPTHRRTIALLNDTPEHAFFDLTETKDQKETAKEIAKISFQEMVKKIEDWESKGNTLEWSNYKKLTINHVGFIPAFSRKDLKVEGDSKTLNAIGRSWGPSWRMIVAFGPGKPKAYGIYPGGQSGNPGSRNYDSMLEDWAAGKYYELELMDRQ
jgi:Protein related to penicillin acylase